MLKFLDIAVFHNSSCLMLAFFQIDVLMIDPDVRCSDDPDVVGVVADAVEIFAALLFLLVGI